MADGTLKIHFSDYFEVSAEALEEHGAFNISLINDLPLFIDPFLLFNSENPQYQELHDNMIRYLRFLRDESAGGKIGEGLLRAWFTFSEVKQTWLGFSRVGNRGSGLGRDFALALNRNLNTMFPDFGREQVARGSHLEKLCLIREGVGRDNISDFTTNLIKEYLLTYTQSFAQAHIKPELRKTVVADKVRFNYRTETWEQVRFDLPWIDGDFVLLTPKDMLTRDDIWISREGLYDDFSEVALSVSDVQLRDQVNNYFKHILAEDADRRARREAVMQVVRHFPQFLEYYIRYKEDHGEEAEALSHEVVAWSKQLFVDQAAALADYLLQHTRFYAQSGHTLEEARARVLFLKDVIENKDGYRIFYVDGQPIKREKDLQILFRLTWFGTQLDVNREVNNGRGAVDYKVSYGSADASLVEFKLASNAQLRRNLENQVEIYKKASDTDRAIKVILFFTEAERDRVLGILKDLGLEGDSDVVLIDARSDNKPSASTARTETKQEV